MASNWMAHSHELNNTDITLPLATSQATKIREQDINFHLYPTSTVITVSKSQSRTVSNVLSTLNRCDRNTSTSCELHVTNTFRPNGGVTVSNRVGLPPESQQIGSTLIFLPALGIV